MIALGRPVVPEVNTMRMTWFNGLLLLPVIEQGSDAGELFVGVGCNCLADHATGRDPLPGIFDRLQLGVKPCCGLRRFDFWDLDLRPKK